MAAFENPALKAFTAHLGGETVFAQVSIRRIGGWFELRHVLDNHLPPEKLRAIPPGEARPMAQFTVEGAFRPLKSAPNLQRGWRMVAPDDQALELALNQIYPGAIADWFAARSPEPPVTHYREFTNRQSGMYRLTQMLTDAQAAMVIRAACHPQFCLKRRLWSVEGLAPDAPEAKSLIPCLEPCALLLEFARKAARLEQGDRAPLSLSAEEWRSLAAALETALAQRDAGVREGDTASPTNPRRLRLLAEKIQSILAAVPIEGES